MSHYKVKSFIIQVQRISIGQKIIFFLQMWSSFIAVFVIAWGAKKF